MNALEFVNSPVLTFRPPRKRQKPIKAQKGGDSTSDFGVPSSATARKWVSPQHEDVKDSVQKLKPVTRRVKNGQRALGVQRRGRYSTAKGGVCCGRTAGSACSQHQDRTIGNSIQHYGLQRRNIRPLVMVGMNKKQNGAAKEENCKQWMHPSQPATNGPCEVVPNISPTSPLRDVTNSVGTALPGGIECSPPGCGSVCQSDGRDRPAVVQCGTPCEHSNGRETQDESPFSLTEVTLLQLSQLASQLPKPGARPISPLLSSSPRLNPIPQCILHDEHRHKQTAEVQDGCPSDCTCMPFSDDVTTNTPQPVEACRVKEQVKEEDFNGADHQSSIVPAVEAEPVQLLSARNSGGGGDRMKENGDDCDDPSMADSFADIIRGLDFDFDLSMSFKTMQISRDSPGKILAPETPLIDGEYITARRKTSAPASRN